MTSSTTAALLGCFPRLFDPGNDPFRFCLANRDEIVCQVTSLG
jgi:hypothetical protein